MGMNLAINSQTFAASEDQSWLGSSHGTSMADSITLKASAFVANFATGIVPSGVVLGKVTATGLYVPYTSGATNGVGSDTPLGHLFTTVDLTNGGLNPTTGSWQDTAAALFYHGEVIISKLPANSGHSGAVTTALPLIKYV